MVQRWFSDGTVMVQWSCRGTVIWLARVSPAGADVATSAEQPTQGVVFLVCKDETCRDETAGHMVQSLHS